MDDFRFVKCNSVDEIRKWIKNDEGRCIQQVCYSTYHDALTQINFTDKVVRSNIELK